MALLSSPDVYGFTLFCDDIRQEVDGKLTYIGVYSADMVVHVPFPVTLPKFAFGITFLQHKRIFDPNIGLRIFLPGDLPNEASIQGNLSEKAEGSIGAGLDAQERLRHPSVRRDPEDEQVVVLHANAILGGLIIKEPGKIRVRAVRGEDMIRLGSLRISPALPFAPTNPT